MESQDDQPDQRQDVQPTTLMTGINIPHSNHLFEQQQPQQHRHRTATTSSNTSSHTMEEDSDMEGSFDEAEEQMEYWLQRCSICFDSPLDLCLEYCRDQYCGECFQRYVTEVVMSSWGLSVTTVKCPVCQETIPQFEWSQFVPQSVVDHYNRFNQPYRSFARCCPHCEKESKPCDHTLKVDGVNYMKRIHDMVESLALDDCTEAKQQHSEDDEDDTVAVPDDLDFHAQIHSSLHSLLPLLDDDCPHSTLLDVYQFTMKTLFIFERYHQQTINTKHLSTSASTFKDSPIRLQCFAISYEFTMLDMTPEIWKQMQFLHITHFPNTTCLNCHVEFCLQCGHNSHGRLTCEDNMKQLIQTAQSQDHDIVVTTQWYLNNSQRCPNCSIMINREDGCNKMDCSLCGFCFCWACRSPWSEKCGFYNCKMTDVTNCTVDPNVKITHEGKTELGVPNMSTIQARLPNSTST
ncbi:unnamed protein product [Absidia cylindrospora]